MVGSKIVVPCFFTNGNKRLARLLTANERNALEGFLKIIWVSIKLTSSLRYDEGAFNPAMFGQDPRRGASVS